MKKSAPSRKSGGPKAKEPHYKGKASYKGKESKSKETGKRFFVAPPHGAKPKVKPKAKPAAAPVRKKAPPLHNLSIPAPKAPLLWGVHAVREAWLNPKRKCLSLWATESGLASMEETFQKAENRGLSRPTPVKVERAEIDALLSRGTVHQGLILEAEPLPEMSLDDLLGLDEGPDLVVILDQVTDPHNVGAALRSAAAFGADAVIVTERNAPGATGILAKTASGAAEHVPLIPVVNLARALDALKAESFWCVGLAEEGEKDLSESSLGSGRIALVMGAEGEGLRRLTRERCDELARLPTSGPIGSLNVSNAAAVALYEVVRQKNSRMADIADK